MAATNYSIEDIKKIIEPIAKKYQVAKVFLFGSFARGDYSEESDIDLRIDKGNMQGMFALSGFYTEVSEAVDRKVDMLTTGSLDDTFLNEIKNDEVLIYADE